jgi:hypothetical protein
MFMAIPLKKMKKSSYVRLLQAEMPGDWATVGARMQLE